MRRRPLIMTLVLAVLVAIGSVAVLAEPQASARKPGPRPYRVALIGDFPYDALQERQAQNLFEELNAAQLAFIAHVGDIKSGSSACTVDVYQKEFRRFEASRNPLVYTPGDNEWTDCHRLPNPSPEEADPLNRLDLLRSTFFATGGSLGRETIPLTRQSGEYPENARWRRGGVTFATLHLVGSNNNRPTTADPAIGNEAEYGARNAANLAWLEGTFDRARASRSRAVMLITQANPFEADIEEPSGFTGFRAALERETVAFRKPVVLVHGDTHTFRVDRPVISKARPPNFTRVETFGSPKVHWVRASVNPRNSRVFAFERMIVKENVTP